MGVNSKYTRNKKNMNPSLRISPFMNSQAFVEQKNSLLYFTDQCKKNQDIQSCASVFSAELSYRPNFQKPQTNSSTS